MSGPPPEEGGADVALPIASVQIDLARFVYEVGKIPVEKRADWLASLAECLALRDPSLHAYGGTLLLEAERYRDQKSQKGREAALRKQSNQSENKDLSQTADPWDGEGTLGYPRQPSVPPAIDRQIGSQIDRKKKDPLTPAGGLTALGQETLKAFTDRVISYLNRKTGKNFKVVKGTERLISARLKDGFQPTDFKTVIDNKCADWLRDEKMEQYLRPVTLFGQSKMEGYLNQLSSGASSEPQNGKTHNAHHRVQPEIFISGGGENG